MKLLSKKHDIFSVIVRDRFEENPTLEGEVNLIDPQTGEPVMQPVFDEVLNPETGEPEKDEYGAIILAPINEFESDLAFADVDIKVESVNYNNAEERNQLLFETFLQGPVGQYVGQMDPVSYLQVAKLIILHQQI